MSRTRIRVPRGAKVQREQSRVSRVFCILIGAFDVIIGVALYRPRFPLVGGLSLVMGLLCLRHGLRRYETIN